MFVLNAALSLAAGIAGAQPQTAAPRPGPVWRIVLPNDWDCIALGDDLDRALREASEGHSPLVVLEIEGNLARADVTHRVAQSLRAASVPTAVWLTGGPDRGVGVGQLVASQFTGMVICGNGVTLRGRGRGECEHLAPERTAWDLTLAELRGWLEPKLGERGASESLTAVLTSGPELPPASHPALLRVVERRNEPAMLESTATELVALRLADRSCEEWRRIPAMFDIRGAEVRTRRIDTCAQSLRRGAIEALTRTDQAYDAAMKALDLPDPARREAASGAYREAARRAQPHLGALRDATESLERDFTRAPEVLRTPAPGQPDDETPSACSARWKSLLRTRRDRLARLEAKAQTFAAQ